MATILFPAASDARAFPSPGVMAGIHRAMVAARDRRPRLTDLDRTDRTGRGVDRTFVARRLHVVRRDLLARVARAVGPSVPA